MFIQKKINNIAVLSSAQAYTVKVLTKQNFVEKKEEKVEVIISTFRLFFYTIAVVITSSYKLQLPIITQNIIRVSDTTYFFTTQ